MKPGAVLHSMSPEANASKSLNFHDVHLGGENPSPPQMIGMLARGTGNPMAFSEMDRVSGGLRVSRGSAGDYDYSRTQAETRALLNVEQSRLEVNL